MAWVKAANGKTLLIFDPTDEETPVGLIRAELQGAWGNISVGDASQVLQMPVLSPESSGLTRKGVFTLAADGSIAGDVHETFVGDDATNERWFLKDSDAKEVRETLEKNIASDLPNVAFKSYEFGGAPNLDQPLKLDLHLEAATFAHPSGTLLLLRPRVLRTQGRVRLRRTSWRVRSAHIRLRLGIRGVGATASTSRCLRAM